MHIPKEAVDTKHFAVSSDFNLNIFNGLALCQNKDNTILVCCKVVLKDKILFTNTHTQCI